MSHQTDQDDARAFQVTAVVLAAALLVAVLALTGCSARDFDPRTWFGHHAPPATAAEAAEAEQARLGYAAEAAAGCEAIERGYVAPAALEDAAAGAGAFVRATAGKARLPAPAWTVNRVATEPAAYRDAGEKAERTANGTQVWFWLKVGAGFALPVVLALAKGIPGLGGVLGGFAELAWHAYAPKATKQDEKAQATLASHTANVLKMVQAVLPPNDLRAAIEHLPPEVVEAAKRQGIVLPPPAADLPPRPTPAA